MKDDVKKTDPDHYTIVELQAQNLQRIKAVRIKPDGTLVQITGRNDQGKSSIFDAIEMALEGGRAISAEPIRRGTDEGSVRLDLGELVVERTFSRREDGSAKSEVKITKADGSRLGRPQEVLDTFFGKLTFDPLAFDRLDNKGKLEQLKALVPGVDFEAIARADKADRLSRTDVGREYDRWKAHAASIVVADNVSDKPIDTEALRTTIEAARKYNAEIDTWSSRRQGAEEAIENKLDRAEKLRAEASELEEEAAALQAKLDKAEPLPAKQDVAELERELEAAAMSNAQVEKRVAKTTASTKAKEYGVEYDRLTKQIESRLAAKAQAIARAKLPVAGVGFAEDDTITLDGFPFEQASTANRIKAAVELAMALNPKLRVICIREGSLLDKGMLTLIGKLAAERGYSVWLECVRDDRAVGFVIDDGELVAVNGKPVHA